MKILWIKADFLHPTTKGGHIRTLEILRRLYQRHEVHYVGLTDPGQEEGPRRSREYSTFSHAIVHEPPRKDSAAFAAQLAAGLFSRVPVAISRYRSDAMTRKIEELHASQSFDQVVCDFLAPSINIRDFSGCVLFQHNVETAIWRRHVEHAPDALRKFYFGVQARRMFDYERKSCLAARHVIAVSKADAELMKEWFGAQRVSVVPTGVDIEYFRRPQANAAVADLIFVGSMDWLPNVDGIQYFVREILPLIRRKRPGCTVAVVGRSPLKQITELAEKDSGIRVTGTVPDIRPYLWGSAVSIVPLRIGGGTRLKIYESMAAGTPVVSTSIGAEGLDVSSPGNIRLADSPEAFAENCLALLDDAAERARTSEAAWEHVNVRFSWDRVVECFEKVLESAS